MSFVDLASFVMRMAGARALPVQSILILARGLRFEFGADLMGRELDMMLQILSTQVEALPEDVAAEVKERLDDVGDECANEPELREFWSRVACEMGM